MLLFLIKLNDYYIYMKLDMGLWGYMMVIGCFEEIIGYNINVIVIIKIKYIIIDRIYFYEGWDVGN